MTSRRAPSPGRWRACPAKDPGQSKRAARIGRPGSSPCRTRVQAGTRHVPLDALTDPCASRPDTHHGVIELGERSVVGHHIIVPSATRCPRTGGTSTGTPDMPTGGPSSLLGIGAIVVGLWRAQPRQRSPAASAAEPPHSGAPSRHMHTAARVQGCAAGVRHTPVGVHCAPPGGLPRAVVSHKQDQPSTRRRGHNGAPGPAITPMPRHPPPSASGCNSGCSSPRSRRSRASTRPRSRTSPDLHEP